MAPSNAFSAVPAGYYLDLPLDTRRKVAWRTDQDSEAVEASLVSAYRGTVLSADWRPLRLSPVSWVHQRNSLLCPLCIRDGWWRLSWKLPWSFACRRHGVLLASTCPNCLRLLGGNKADGACLPAFAAMRPLPGRCLNAKRAEGVRRNNRCGYLLSDVEAFPADEVLLTAQRQIDEVMVAGTGMLLGADVSSVEWFAALRSVVALASWCALPDDLHLPHDRMRSILEQHAATRQQHTDERAAIRSSGEATWRGPAKRHWGAVPKDPLFVASLVPLALDVMTSPLEDDRPSLDLLAERVRARNGVSPINACRQFHTPMPLAKNIAKRSVKLVRFAVGRGSAVDLPLESRHIPTLFWREHYSHSLSGVFPPAVDERHGRRFAAVAMHRLLFGSTWQEALAATMSPIRPRRDISYARLGLHLRRNGTEEAFRGALTEVAAVVARGSDGLVDFCQRRVRFGAWVLPMDDWNAICVEAGTTVGRHQRMRCASAWCWAALTGCRWEDAPSWGPDGVDAWGRTAYGKFEQMVDGGLDVALDSYVTALIRGVANPIRHAPRAVDRIPKTSFADARPDLALEWHPTLNGSLTPILLTPRSPRRIWWQCGRCGRAWSASLRQRSKAASPGCPACRGRKLRKPLSDNAVISADWHRTRNGGLTPEVVSHRSEERHWWQCQCGKEWQSTVRNHVRLGPRCAACRAPRRLLLSDNALLSAEWHPERNVGRTPREVPKLSTERAWWLCACGREWQQTVRTRTASGIAGCLPCRRRSSR